MRNLGVITDAVAMFQIPEGFHKLLQREWPLRVEVGLKLECFSEAKVCIKTFVT